MCFRYFAQGFTAARRVLDGVTRDLVGLADRLGRAITRDDLDAACEQDPTANAALGATRSALRPILPTRSAVLQGDETASSNRSNTEVGGRADLVRAAHLLLARDEMYVRLPALSRKPYKTAGLRGHPNLGTGRQAACLVFSFSLRCI